MEPCSGITEEIKSKMVKSMEASLVDLRERTFRICASKDGELYSTPICVGTDCKITTSSNKCKDDRELFGFHTHTHGPYSDLFSPNDIRHAISVKHDIACLGDAPNKTIRCVRIPEAIAEQFDKCERIKDEMINKFHELGFKNKIHRNQVSQETFIELLDIDSKLEECNNIFEHDVEILNVLGTKKCFSV